MANIKSQIKRNKTNVKAYLYNKKIKSKCKTLIKKVKLNCLENKLIDAENNIKQAFKALDKAAQKKVYHQTNVNHKKAKLQILLNKIKSKTK